MIAVLDYGIGNLRSAEKALQHLGADARLVDDPDEAAAADGVVLPGVGAFGRVRPGPASPRGLDQAAPDGRRAAGCRSSGSASGSSCSTRAPTRPRPSRARRAARHGPAPARRGQAPPDAVEHRSTAGRTRVGPPGRAADDPAWVYFVHSYAPELTEDTTVHVRLRRAGHRLGRTGRGVGHPVPPREVRGGRAGHPGQLRRGPSTDAAPRDGPLSGHRHPRRRGRPADPGGLRPSDATTATRWPWPDGSPPAAPPGCTWSTSTPPGPGRPVNRPTVLAIAAAVDVPVETGGGVRTEADVAELLAGGVQPGGPRHRWPSTTRTWSARWLPASRVRWPSGSTTGSDADGRTEVAVRGWEQGSGRTVAERPRRAGRRAELAAVIVTAIDRDGTLAGPDLAGWPACWRRPSSR